MNSSHPRIGLGSDRHRLVEGRLCRLGGIDFECPVGPLGHSDGDAVLHALCDALLGAAGLDDLGTLFPDTDPQWSGADSSQLTAAVVDRVRERGFRCVSADLVVQCDRPKIGPKRTELRAKLAELLQLPADAVNIKGKTREQVDSGVEAVDVTAVVLLVAESL